MSYKIEIFVGGAWRPHKKRYRFLTKGEAEAFALFTSHLSHLMYRVLQTDDPVYYGKPMDIEIEEDREED